MNNLNVLGSAASLPHQARAIVELVARGRAASRSDLAKQLGVAPSTASLRVQELIELGVLREVGEGTSRGGRRPRTLQLSDRRSHIMVADVGGQHVRIGRLDLTGTLVDTRNIPVRVKEGPEKTLQAIAAVMREMDGDEAQHTIRGIALSLPGPVDVEFGRVVLPSRMPGWQNFPVAQWLEEEFGVSVVVENDANLMALGEHHAQLGSTDHSITVKAGTAIGSGIIVRGTIYRGATAAAGDVTHTRIAAAEAEPCSCGNTGCLETVASGAALVRQLRIKGFTVASTSDVLALTVDADPVATALVRTAGTHLGEVLSTIVNFFNPHALFLTGGMSSCEPFIAAVRSRIYEGCHPLATQSLRIESANSGPNAGLLGGGRLVLEKILFTGG